MKKKLPLSTIIITLNERKNLSSLLPALEKQTFHPSQIIISDAGSKDGTVEIAKRYGCHVVRGGMPGKGRNNGAKAASWPYLLFLDADTLPGPINDSKKFLENLFFEAVEKNYDAATCDNLPRSDKLIYRAGYAVFNDFQRRVQSISPVAVGTCIFSTKYAFEKVNGFNESMRFGEDSDYVLRLHKAEFKFGVLDKAKILVSVRRFEEEGVFDVGERSLRYYMKRMILGDSVEKLKKIKILEKLLDERYDFGKHKS